MIVFTYVISNDEYNIFHLIYVFLFLVTNIYFRLLFISLIVLLQNVEHNINMIL